MKHIGRARRPRGPRLALVGLLSLIVLGLFASVASADVGQARTAGTTYDRNPSVVQDGAATYLFFARSKAPCNRLSTTPCNPDNAKYDLYYKKSLDGGKTYGPATLAVSNPEPSTDFRGRTIAATQANGQVLIFWADGGSQKQLYYVQKASGSDTFSGPAPVLGFTDVFNVEAVTRAATGQTFLYTEQGGVGGYGIYASMFSGGVASPPTPVAADRNIPKAIVDNQNGAIRMTYVDATHYPDVDVYVNTSQDGLAFTQERLVVDAAPGESNWDPNLVQKPNGEYYLHFAPDREQGAGPQQIALTKSNNFVKWTAPHDITPAKKGSTEYWDYWPEGFVYKNKLTLYYTSERGFDQYPTGIGHIWSDPGEGGLDGNPNG